MFSGKETFDLIARMADEPNLRAAWRAVRRNKGQEGLDGVSVLAFQDHLDMELHNIQRGLRQHTYQPRALKRITVLKRDQRPRLIGVPTVADRVVQHAILNVLEPLFEPSFSLCSYGFRPGRSAHQAVQAVVNNLRQGLLWVIEADLRDFFDSLDWNILRQALEARAHDPHLIDLIHRFLQAGALQGQDAAPLAQGTPQGAVFSPLFANVYLDSFDRHMMSHGYRLIRYADDLLTLHRTQDEATHALALMRQVLEGHLKLRLNTEKTGIRDAKHQSLDFLSFRFRIDAVSPTPQAVERFKARVCTIIQAQEGRGRTAIVDRLNPLIRGWGEYFKIGQVSDLYRQLDRWIATQLGESPGPASEIASLTALVAGHHPSRTISRKP